MRILICGATGFIGRNTAEWFVKNTEHDVIGVYHKRPPSDIPGLSWCQADLTNSKDIEKIVPGVDIIIQAAATTSGSKDIIARPYIHVTDNAIMNSLLFRSAHENNVKHVVFFSCSIMYPRSDLPLKESDFDANTEIQPNYFAAGWTKVFIEKQCEFYLRLNATKYTVLRHSNVYGPYDKFDLEHSHVFGATITKVMTAKNGNLSVWGTGEEGRDLLYIDDLITMTSLVLNRQKSPFGLYNVGSGSAISINDLVKKLLQLQGKIFVSNMILANRRFPQQFVSIAKKHIQILAGRLKCL